MRSGRASCEAAVDTAGGIEGYYEQPKAEGEQHHKEGAKAERPLESGQFPTVRTMDHLHGAHQSVELIPGTGFSQFAGVSESIEFLGAEFRIIGNLAGLNDPLSSLIVPTDQTQEPMTLWQRAKQSQRRRQRIADYQRAETKRINQLSADQSVDEQTKPLGQVLQVALQL